MLDQLKLAIVDVETTGASVTGDRVIEIGVQRIERGRIVRTFESLIDPEQRIPWFIERLTGIRNEDLEGAPPFRVIREELEAILQGCVFVAHNVGFDYGLVCSEFARLGRAFSAPCLCSVRLSRRLYPRFKRHNLSELITRFRLPCRHRHRALGDAEAVWAFLQVAHRQAGPDRFAAAVKALLRTPMLPPQLPVEQLQQLPDGPGVYIFYDGIGRPLYVGRGRDVRSRVLSHLGGDDGSGRARRLCQHAARIESHPAYGELGARLLEAHLIKTLAPRYHPRTRVSRTRGAGRLQPWPYAGAVMLEEAAPDRSAGHVFVVDRWRLLHAFRYDEAGTRLFLPPQASFDYDPVSQILADHLRRHPRAAKPCDPARLEPLADPARL